jgi:hypothetical protein
LTLVFSLAACGSDDGDTADDATTTAVADGTTADDTTADDTTLRRLTPPTTPATLRVGLRTAAADRPRSATTLGQRPVLFSADVDFGPTEADITSDTTLVYEGGVLRPGRSPSR